MNPVNHPDEQRVRHAGEGLGDADRDECQHQRAPRQPAPCADPPSAKKRDATCNPPDPAAPRLAPPIHVMKTHALRRVVTLEGKLPARARCSRPSFMGSNPAVFLNSGAAMPPPAPPPTPALSKVTLTPLPSRSAALKGALAAGQAAMFKNRLSMRRRLLSGGASSAAPRQFVRRTC